MNIKLSKGIICGDNVIAFIYDSDTYGKVIVFRDSKIEIDKEIKVFDMYSGEDASTDKSLVELICEVLPK